MEKSFYYEKINGNILFYAGKKEILVFFLIFAYSKIMIQDKRFLSTLYLLIAFISLMLIAPFNLIAEEESDDNSLSIVLSETLPALNPVHAFTTTEAQIFSAIHEGLVSYHPLTMQPLPGAAKDWTVSDDFRTYTFTLRSGLYFWDGQKLTAQDFYDSWLYFIAPETGSEYSFLFDLIKSAYDFRKGEITDPKQVGIKVLAPDKIQVELADPAPHFLHVICHHSFIPLHPKVLSALKKGEEPPLLSNGPYYVLAKRKDQMLLERNQLYWGHDYVQVPQIRLLFSDDSDKMTALYNKGEVDWLAASYNIDQINNKDDIQLNALFGTSFLYFRSHEFPWNDGRVRRALALMLPWLGLRRDQLLPASVLVPPYPNYPKLSGINFPNKEEAYELLKEAGFPEGRGLSPLRIKYVENSMLGEKAKLIKKILEKELNMIVLLMPVSSRDYFDSLEKNDYDIAPLHWIGDFADPLTFLMLWSSSSNMNSAKLNNPEYDKLLQKSMKMEGEERLKILSEAEDLLLQSAVIMPMGHIPSINIINTNYVGGWFKNRLDIHPFKYLRYLRHIDLDSVARFFQHD